MSKKVLNVATFGLSGLLIGSGKKKEAAPVAATTAPSTTSNRPKPIITQLGDGASLLRARQQAGLTGGSLSGGLSNKLGS